MGEVQNSIHDALEPLAKRFIAEAKSKDSDPECIFLLAKGGGPIDQLKELTKKHAGDVLDRAAGKPVMMLFDIPDNGGFYVADTRDITTTTVEAFLKSKS